MSRNWIIALTLLALVVVAIVSLLNEKRNIESSLNEKLTQSILKPGIELSGATFKEIANGVTFWELQAKESDINEDTQVARLQGTRGTFFEDGMPSLRFISPSAIWKRGDGAIRLNDILGYTLAFEKEVLTRMKNDSSTFFFSSADAPHSGAWFHADSLLWSVQKQKIVCERGVKLHQGNVHVRASTLQSDVGLRTVELTGKPEAWVSEVKIKATRFALHRLQYTLDATGPVEIKRGEAKAMADNLHYNEKTQLITLLGGVQFTFEDISGAGAKAYYDLEKEVLTFMGNPRVTQKGNAVSGERISVSLQDRSVQVTGTGRAIIDEETLPNADR